MDVLFLEGKHKIKKKKENTIANSAVERLP